jgi:hypothetical protein
VAFTHIQHAHMRSQARKDDFIRLLEPRLVGHSSSCCRYSTTRKIQTGEWKYCTDNNLKDNNDLMLQKYTPLANALRSHWLGKQGDIIPIVMSRTGTSHVLTLTNITSFSSTRERTHGQTSSYLPPRHIPHHVLSTCTQCSHYLPRIYRIKSLTTRKQLHCASHTITPKVTYSM